MYTTSYRWRTSPRPRNYYLTDCGRYSGNRRARGSGRGGEEMYTPRDVSRTSYSGTTGLDSREPMNDKVLKVSKVDLKVSSNTKVHHTDKYEIASEFTWVNGRAREPQLVVRRGQPFSVEITFDRDYDKTKDDIKLVFETSDSPRASNGTRVTMLVSDKDEPGEWGAVLVSANRKATVQIFTPPDCYIAKWRLKVVSVMKDGDKTKLFQYSDDQSIFMLLNPWCKDDSVYMGDADMRDEYVLADHGQIYRGTKKQISAKAWNFGQFEDFVLECVFHLLDKSELAWKQRGNPVLIARKISAVVNASDEDGVLVGNWSGDYSGGKSPLAWAGSVKILEEYWRYKKPVQFGQCWVFSGVTTTVARAIGLPARSVTNFASAHDSDGTITIDRHWTYDGQPLEELNADSVWNFHVWNDVWMDRPDLPEGYGGWQAIDATPQETSDGIYCAGPASLKAIKNGESCLLYDAPFIFAEVNADRINWIQRPDGSWAKSAQPDSIGKSISTKGVKIRQREDITCQYKHSEGTKGERTAVYKAVRQMGKRQDVYDESCEDLEIELVEKDSALLGQPFSAICQMTNKSDQERKVELTLSAGVVFYTGVVSNKLKSKNFQLTLPPKKTVESKMVVEPDEYVEKLVDMCNVQVSYSVFLPDTNQVFCDSDDFRLIKPDLQVKAPSKVKVGDKYEVELSFTNPIQNKLTNCSMSIEGASLQAPLETTLKDVKPKEEVKTSYTLTAKLAGDREIIGIFESKEVSDIHGSTKVTVVE